MTTPDAKPRERVSLVEEEVVVGGRTSRVSFRVRFNDGWVPAKFHETARVEQLSRGPGVVFRTRIELSLPAGTVLERTRSEQRPDEKSALEHLVGRASEAKRRVTRTRLTVGARGELLPEPPATK